MPAKRHRPRLLSVAILTACSAAHAHAANRIAIPPQSLDGALNQLAEASGLEISYPGELSSGLRSARVEGDYSTKEALDKLLAGTGLAYRYTGTGAVTLERTAQPLRVAENSTPELELPAVRVEDEANKPRISKPEQAARSYSVTKTSTATKTETPIIETPVSIQVIPRAVMDDQQAISVADAVKNVSGVQPGGYTFYDTFILRGFDANFSTFRNGLRHQSTTSLETANLQSIEVLKGPAAVLFGRSEPGGLVNLTTKRPLEDPYYSIQQQFGSFELFRTTIDATGPILEDRSLLYRANLAYKNNNSFQDKVSQESIFFAPSVTWRPNDSFVANFDIEYQHNEFVDISDNGIPAIGTRPAPVPISRFLGDPAARNIQERILVGFDWTYRFSDDWKLVNRFQFNDVSYDQATLFALALDADNRTLNRGLWRADMNRRTFAANLDLIGRFETGILEHEVLAGFDFYRFDGESKAFAGQTPVVPPIDIFNPRYGVNLSSITPSTYNQFSLFPEQWYGVYFQDQITLLEKIHILGGGRQDWAEIGSGFSETSLNNASIQYDRTDYFSPRVGVVYQPWEWLSFYGNYVESLGSNNSGTPLPGSGSLAPQTAQQWELGIKTALFDGKLTSTLAYFDLTKQNVRTRIPGETFDRTIGEAHSKGVELDLSGQITENISLIGSYAYTDAKITKDFSGTEGNQLISVPKNSGSLWAKYEFDQGPLSGLSFGTGMFARSARMADNENTAKLPGYVRWDASMAYSFKYSTSKITPKFRMKNPIRIAGALARRGLRGFQRGKTRFSCSGTL